MTNWKLPFETLLLIMILLDRSTNFVPENNVYMIFLFITSNQGALFWGRRHLMLSFDLHIGKPQLTTWDVTEQQRWLIRLVCTIREWQHLSKYFVLRTLAPVFLSEECTCFLDTTTSFAHVSNVYLSLVSKQQLVL